MADEFASARKRIMVDFDGVIHRNDHWNWNQGKCEGPPIEGALEAIRGITSHGYSVVVFTARDVRSIIEHVEPWLRKNKFGSYHKNSSGEWILNSHLRVTNIKEPAQFYIDDRAYRFTNWHDVTRLVS